MWDTSRVVHCAGWGLGLKIIIRKLVLDLIEKHRRMNIQGAPARGSGGVAFHVLPTAAVKRPGSISWTWEHKCQSVTQLNAPLPCFKAVMIAYGRGERTRTAKQLRVWCWPGCNTRKTHGGVGAAGTSVHISMCACVCMCAMLDLPQQEQK